VLQLARPSQGKKFIVHPRLMGYKYMEDVEAWLSSSRVESYMNYRFRPAGYTDSPKDVQSTVARRLEKMAAVWPMLGGEVMQERPCVNFTMEFDYDQLDVRAKLQELRAAFQDVDQRGTFPEDFTEHDAESLIIPDPCTGMDCVERAMTAAIRVVTHRVSMVGSPVCITTEPSGTLSIGRWMPDVRDVHGAVSFLPRPGIMADLDSPSFYATLIQEFGVAGLVAKHCAGHDLNSSVPGLKSNFMIPQVLILLWQYELKTPFTTDDCCIVKELFGTGQRFGYICWVRKWKFALGIPCEKYPTIAYLRIGSWVASIAHRPLPEKLANFKLKTPDVLAAELKRINEALPPDAKKRRWVRQEAGVGTSGVAQSQTESQSLAQIFAPVKNALSELPNFGTLSQEQKAKLSSCLRYITNISALGDDEFDTIPDELDPDNMNEEELRAALKCIMKQ
jgi:hypothetical protein